MANPTEYQKYQAWRSKPLNPSFLQKYSRCIFYGTRCRLCKYLHEWRQSRGESGLLAQQKGAPNKALKLGSYLVIQSSESLVLGQTYSIVVWVKFLDTHQKVSQRILDRNNAGKVTGFNFDVTLLDGSWYLRLCAAHKCMMSIRSMRPQVWNHVAVTFDSTTINGVKFYINGNYDCSHNTYKVPTDTISVPMVLGSTADPQGTESLEGHFDDLSVWSRVLNVSEVQILQFQKLAGDEVGLELYYDFNGEHSVSDLTANNRHGKPPDGKKLEFEPSNTKTLYVNKYD